MRKDQEINAYDLFKETVRSFGFSQRFPKQALRDADAAINKPANLEEREDFRGDIVFTIDGDDAQDFDDAVSIKRIQGGYQLGVHIADVAHYVTENSPLDKEAKRRGTSVYLPTLTLPMLPEALSNGVCSLKENEDRFTLSVVMNVADGKVTSHKISEGIIRSKARMTYKKAAAILDGDEQLAAQYPQIVEPLKTMLELYNILAAKRKQRGALEIETSETEFEIEGGKVVGFGAAQTLVTHRIIEEFMILTNSTVAERFSKMGTPLVYRVHMPPPPEKRERLSLFLGSLGMKARFLDSEKEPTPHDFAALLDGADSALKPVLGRMVLRSMSKADYRGECKGHFGLSLKFYCHFTSPIRRYPDLLVHRIVKAWLKGESLKKYRAAVLDSAPQSSQTERTAEEAERKCSDIFVADCMRAHIGEAFEGIISGVTGFGFFVMLNNTAEGLVRVDKLQGWYTFNESALSLVGPKVYKMGQKVTIEVLAVNADKIEFGLRD